MQSQEAKTVAQAVIAFGKIASSLVVVAGMHAENTSRHMRGYSSPAYDEAFFIDVANEINAVVAELEQSLNQLS